MDRRSLLARVPRFRCWQSFTPGNSAIRASLKDERPLAVPFRINAQDSLAVFKQDGGRMAKILYGLTIDDHLTICLVREINERNAVTCWR